MYLRDLNLTNYSLQLESKNKRVLIPSAFFLYSSKIEFNAPISYVFPIEYTSSIRTKLSYVGEPVLESRVKKSLNSRISLFCRYHHTKHILRFFYYARIQLSVKSDVSVCAARHKTVPCIFCGSDVFRLYRNVAVSADILQYDCAHIGLLARTAYDFNVFNVSAELEIKLIYTVNRAVEICGND